MNTPRWYGSIGVMNASHLHRKRRQGLHRRAAMAFAAAFRCIGMWRERARGGGVVGRTRARPAGAGPVGRRRAGRQLVDIRSR